MNKNKGDCYKANAEFIMKLFPDIKKSHKIFLCHGKVVGTKGSKVEDITFKHAWIEINEMLLDCSNGRLISHRIKDLYDKGRIIKDSVIRYTPQKAMEMILKHEHYGPW